MRKFWILIILMALIAGAIAACSKCSADNPYNEPIVLNPNKVRVIERDVVELWCNAETCEVTSGKTTRVRWAIPKNTSKFYKTYELWHDGRMFKTYVQDPKAKKTVWRTDYFSDHRRQRIMLLAAVAQGGNHTVVSTLDGSLTLPHGGYWSVYAWVDECRRPSWPCLAPITYLAHKW